MSNAALKEVTQGKPAQKTDLAHVLTSPGTLAQIKAALPRHMTAERMARVALTEMRKTPKLGKCDPRTFIGAVIQLSQLGLEPGGALGHAYLIPFENRKQGSVDVQIIIGYRGMIDLARRSGQIASIQAVVVREGDEFDVELGLDPKLRHVPAFDSAQPMTFVYAVAVFKDGARQFEVMSRTEIERVRNASQGYKTAVKYEKDDNPWMTHPDEMAKKTVIRRLFKYLPVSIELQRAVVLDERGDAGLSQIVDDVGAIDGTATEIHEDAPRLTGNSDDAGAETEKSAPPKQPAPSEEAPAEAAKDNGFSDASIAAGVTLAKVLDKMQAAHKAKDTELLDAHADLIRSLPKEHQEEARTEYKRLRAEIAAA